MPDSRPAWMDEMPADEQLDAELAASIDNLMQNRQNPSLKFAPGTFAAGSANGYRPEDAPIPQSVSTPLPPGAQPSSQPVVGQTPAGLGGGALPPGVTPDTAPQPVPGAAAAGQEGADGKPLPPPAPGVAPVVPEVPDTFAVTLPSGDTWQMTNDQAAYLLSVNNWLSGLPQEVRDQWRQIETGDAVAVPRSDYEAWKASRQTPPAVGTPNVAPSTTPARPQGYDPALVPGEIADYIAKLEARQATPSADTPPQTAPQLPPPGTPTAPVLTPAQQEARIQHEASRQVAINTGITAARDKIAATYGLTQEQVTHLSNVTPNLNIIPGIMAKYRSLSPTGQVLNEDFVSGFTEVFETAMLMDPSLRSIRDSHIFNQQTAATAEAAKTVNGKKAAAGSLATAPSAAVPSPTVDMSKLNPGQRQAFIQDRMREELAMAMSGQSIDQ